MKRKALGGLEMAATSYLRMRTLITDGHLLNRTPFFDSSLNPFSGAALTLASDDIRILMITQVDVLLRGNTQKVSA